MAGGVDYIPFGAGILQAVVALLLISSHGDPRLRRSLALLFILNAIVAVTAFILLDSSSVLVTFVHNVADKPTGAVLVYVGVLLAGARLQRFVGPAFATMVAALVVFPFLFAILGASAPIGIVLGDLLIHAGFAAVFLGTVLGMRGGAFSPFRAAVLLAFAPRSIEFVVYAVDRIVVVPGASVGPLELVQLSTGILYLAVTGATAAAFIMKRLRVPASLLGICLGLGIAPAFGKLFLDGVVIQADAVFPFFTLFLIRPLFVAIAIASGTVDDPLSLPARELFTRTASAGGGVACGLVILPVLGDPYTVLPAAQVFLILSFTVLGYSMSGFAAPVAAPRGPSPPPTVPDELAGHVRHAFGVRPPTQGDRVLLALRGIVFEPGATAPTAASTRGVSEATGIAGKHIPEIVRRLNERSADGPLVVTSPGPVRGVRQRVVARYFLSDAGFEQASRLATSYGLAHADPSVVRQAMAHADPDKSLQG